VIWLGRKLRVIFEVYKGNPSTVFNDLRNYLVKNGYTIIETKEPTKIVAKAGSKFMTYVIGTKRWEKAIRTAYITIKRIHKKLIEVDILWEVSWLSSIISMSRAARFEVKAIAKAIGGKVRGYIRVPAF